MSWERPCDLCRVLTREDVLERVEDVFPLGLVCPACAVELHEDEAHPREPGYTERECSCSRGCVECVAVRGWLW